MNKNIEITCKYSIQKLTRKKQKRTIVQSWNKIDNNEGGDIEYDNSRNDIIKTKDTLDFGEKKTHIITPTTNYYNLSLLIDDTMDDDTIGDDTMDDTKTISKIKAKVKNEDINNLFNNNKLQFEILCDLYMNYDLMNDENNENNENNENRKNRIKSIKNKYLYFQIKDRNPKNYNQYKVIIQEITNKLRNYKYQDIHKNKLDEERLINFERCIELIIKQKLKCYYCSKEVFIIYEYIRDLYQWSLDRIDNDQGHNKENCVICCLKCNLQRRKLNDEKFLFTKKMNIIYKK